MINRGGKSGDPVGFAAAASGTEGSRDTGSGPIAPEPETNPLEGMSVSDQVNHHTTGYTNAKEKADEARENFNPKLAEKWEDVARVHQNALKSLRADLGAAPAQKKDIPLTIPQRVQAAGKHERSERDVVNTAMGHLNGLESHFKTLDLMHKAMVNSGRIDALDPSGKHLLEAPKYLEAARTLLTDKDYTGSYPYHKALQNRAEKHQAMSDATEAIAHVYRLLHHPDTAVLGNHPSSVDGNSVFENREHALSYSSPQGLGFKRKGEAPKTVGIAGIKLNLAGAKGAIDRVKEQVANGEYQGDPTYVDRILGQAKPAKRLTAAEKKQRYADTGAQTDEERRIVANLGARKGAKPVAEPVAPGQPVAAAVTPPRPGDDVSSVEDNAPLANQAPKVVSEATTLKSTKTTKDVAKVAAAKSDAYARAAAARVGKVKADNTERSTDKANKLVEAAARRGMTVKDIEDSQARLAQQPNAEGARQAEADRRAKVEAEQKKINAQKLRAVKGSPGAKKKLRTILKDMGKI
jgi:hypothetical protein